LEAIEATIIQAKVRPNPEIAALIEDTRQATRTTTLQLNQPIELGGKRASRIDAAERGRDAASAELDAKHAEIRAVVVAAFFDVLVAQERLRLAQGSVELAQRASGAASRRVAAGKVSPVEETRARVAEAGVRIELTLAISELATARKRLAGTWGNPTLRFERADGDLNALPPLPALADLNNRLATSPNLLRAKIEVDRRQALVEIERSRRVPNMTLSFGAKRDEQLGRNQAIFGLSIPIPVFDRNQGNLLEALHRTDKARDDLSATEIRLSNELTFAYERLNTARGETESLRQDILPGAQSAYDAATKGFELGKFSFLDVLDAQRTSFQAKSQYLRALAEAHRSAAEIERILGEASATPDVTKP
jgi:cobalt-zinc-cadmium efflux system outer membrane protein